MHSNLKNIKAVIGLGNPGSKFYSTRHNIGFQILDALCEKYNGSWKSNGKMDLAQIQVDTTDILLIKPQTFMNSSGQVIPFLKNKNIESENILVVHDELELPFGVIKLKFEGSPKGHNGLKSLISFCGPDFYRLRIGIGRPETKELVPDYVLSNFSKAEQEELKSIIDKALTEISNIFQ